MARLTRRSFLVGGVATVAGGLAACTPLRRSAPAADPEPPRRRPSRGRLVVVTLDGGNDGLNTVAPVTDTSYRSLRGALALDPSATHEIGEGFVLHPALAGCKQLWDAGRLAVVHGVGFGGLDRSHFHCRDVWQSGDEHDTATGWIGRWLDKTSDSPLDAVAVGNRLPLLARGERASAAVVPTGPFTLPGGGALRAGLDSLATLHDTAPDLHRAVAGSMADLLEVADRIPAEGDDEVDDVAAPTGLAAQLDTVARIIDADLPARVFAVQLGGFDTHANQLATHQQLLTDLDQALTSFLSRVDGVTVLVYSEFGRRVRPNASAGTDHGGAGTVLLAGDVAPGHHGEPPPLDRLADGDLVTTVDFRSVYGGLLEDVLGVEAGDVLGGGVRPMPVVA